MIEYCCEEEVIVAIFFAEELEDHRAKDMLISGVITSEDDARHFSKYFWSMVDLSAQIDKTLPLGGNPRYWVEILYGCFGCYMESVGYGSIWAEETDNAQDCQSVVI
jgi:hypothetical protein